MKLLRFGHVFGAAFLVAGTSIGAGMLALPIISAAYGGFFPSILVYIISWAIMSATGLLFLEISLDMKKDSNLISMSDRYFGKKGKIFTWIIYLFLFYCLSVAYISGGSSIIEGVIGSFFSKSTYALIFTILFGFFVYIGALAVDRINILLMIGLIVSYLFFVFIGANNVNLSNFFVYDFKPFGFSFPVILLSFGYQGIIPSLTYYMKKDAKKIREAILIGTSIAFVVYFIWSFLIFGIVPIEGKFGLKEAFFKNQNAIMPLKYYVKTKYIYNIGQFFGFFSITTSFLGVTLGLFDFISDGFKIPKKGIKKVLIAFLTFFPPLLVTLINPNLFIRALNYAGGIGGTLLLILLPTIMVFSKRYIKKEKASHQLFGGRPFLIFISIFVFFVIFIEIIQEIKHFTS